RALFAPQALPLTRRDARANRFDGVARLATPRSDLPDLSEHVEVLSPQPIGPDSAPPEAAAGQEDLLAIQLDELARKVEARLEQLGAPQPGTPDTDEARRPRTATDTDPHARIVRRFRAFTESQR